jgi:hypothetical protein
MVPPFLKKIPVNRPFQVPGQRHQPTASDNSMPLQANPSDGQTALRDEIMELNKQIKECRHRVNDIARIRNSETLNKQTNGNQSAANMKDLVDEEADLNRQILLRQARIAEINLELPKAPKL